MSSTTISATVSRGISTERTAACIFSPPYQQIEGTEWYKNTANAIYQNINFIDRYSPEYVLILSGDHIYKMDYSKMLAYHKEKNADCTIASLEVPWEEASRFGLMFVNDDGSISEFEEKPKHPRSNKASMGVYIFTWSKLRRYLLEDEANPASGNDFGHDLIPAMHEAGERLFAYQFDGYWKDVGTIDSLWEANLDLLNPQGRSRPERPVVEDIFPHPHRPAALCLARRNGSELHGDRGLRDFRRC